MESLGIGGAEKSLVTLLSQFDYSKYEVDLFLFNPTGEFIAQLPSEVNLLETSEDFQKYIASPKNSITYLLKNKKWKLFLLKVIELIILSFHRFILKKEYIGWRYIRQSIEKFPKEYDAAIGFLEKKSIYFTVDKVISKKKIGWIHIDYEKIDYNYKLDYKYFGELNHIITVSDHCKDVMVSKFPQYKNKFKIIENIISPKFIKNLSNQSISDINNVEGYLIICTVCRLTTQKGIDIAISCCQELVKRGLIFKWIVVGDGEDRVKLQQNIEEKNLNNFIELIGSRSNPYPYINLCDIYVQPSRWEGFGITVAEAKVLEKPIIANAIPEFREQLKHKKTGLLYKSLDEMIYYLENLLLNADLRKMLSQELRNLDLNNRNEILKLEKLLEG